MRLVTATLATCLMGLVLAAPASAHFPATIGVSIPAGGTAMVTSPDLAPNQRSVSVDILGLQSNAINDLGVFLAGLPTLHARVLGCLYLNETLSSANAMVDDSTNSPLLDSLFIALCTQVALQLKNQPAAPATPGPARSAAPACQQARREVAVTVTRVGGVYSAHAKGALTVAKRASPVRVTCRRTATGLTLQIRPTSRRATLRGVIGRGLRLGVVAPATATSSTALRFNFRNA